jgi:outer membrane protein assembly factor BamA
MKKDVFGNRKEGMIAAVLLLIASCFSSSLLGAPRCEAVSDSLPQRPVKFLPLPAFGYEPETKTYLGAVGLFTLDLYTDMLTRTSNAKLEFNYTWRKQSILSLEWDYFFKKEEWFTRGEMLFSRYPDFFYGIGAESKEESELLFESNRIILDGDLYRKIGRKWFAGLGLRYLNYYDLSTGDGINPSSDFGLLGAEVFGIKASLMKDSRDNLLNATEGTLARLLFSQNFSRTDYAQIAIDLRHYQKLNERLVVATRMLHQFSIGSPPFFDLALLGGDRNARGYFYGRFRDKNLSTLQTELRGRLFWRIGAAAFAGLSTVYPDLQNFGIRYFPNYGAGLRFLIDKQENTYLRFDFAFGLEGQNGFYISFGESF